MYKAVLRFQFSSMVAYVSEHSIEALHFGGIVAVMGPCDITVKQTDYFGCLVLK
jgi:hypothetical protein